MENITSYDNGGHTGLISCKQILCPVDWSTEVSFYYHFCTKFHFTSGCVPPPQHGIRKEGDGPGDATSGQVYKCKMIGRDKVINVCGVISAVNRKHILKHN